MEKSILFTIKKMLGLDAAYTPFDLDIVTLINGTIMTLTQLGVGPKDGFTITGPEETWEDFLVNPVLLNAVQQYIFLKVKVQFDPPTSSTVLDAYQKQCAELEWRLNVQAESKEYFEFIHQDDEAVATAARRATSSGNSGSCPFA